MRVFTLGSCLAIAVTLAFSTNLLIETSLRGPLPECSLRAPRTDERQLALDLGRLSRAFATPPQPRPAAAVRPALPLKLIGTLDDHAAAMVETSSGQCRTLRIGDRWNDVELLSVGHGRVIIRRAGALEEVSAGGTTSPALTSRLPIAFTPHGAAIAMQRSELERQLPELARRAMEGGRIVPAFEGPTMIGFRLLAVRAGSLFEELGLKTGDVLETLNGASLSKPEVALGLMTRLRDQRQVALGVKRGDERLTWELSLN